MDSGALYPRDLTHRRAGTGVDRTIADTRGEDPCPVGGMSCRRAAGACRSWQFGDMLQVALR